MKIRQFIKITNFNILFEINSILKYSSKKCKENQLNLKEEKKFKC